MDIPKVLDVNNIEVVDVLSLKPNTWNPNRQSAQQFQLLLVSIQQDGFVQPVIARRTDRMICDGEHRWRAAQALGLPKIMVAWVDASDEELKVGTLTYNWARGNEDLQLTADLMRELVQTSDLAALQTDLQLSDIEVERLSKEILPAEVLSPITLEELEALTPAERPAAASAAADSRREQENALAVQKQAESKTMRLQDIDRYVLQVTVDRSTPYSEYTVVLHAFREKMPNPLLVYNLIQEWAMAQQVTPKVEIPASV